MATREPWDSPEWYGPAYRTVALERLAYAVRQAIGAELVSAGIAAPEVILEREAHRLVVQLRGHVLAERLPPQQVTADYSGEVEVARYATWWDHYKATFRGRWRMSWRRWGIRYRWCRYPYRGVAKVAVRTYWTYPQARTPLPEEFGSPVMVAVADPPETWRHWAY